MPEKITFENYLQFKGITLMPWQMEAAKALLSRMDAEVQQMATGKTFLLNVLSEFVEKHGNNFTA